jgi:DNA-binding transcriptional LysR family regulator
MPLNSSQLHLLRAVRQEGSLARAARALGLTPPAVSQQLARLEREVGSPVVERGARGTSLTRLGVLLAAHGDRVASELASAEETVAEFMGTHAYRLRLGAFPSAAVALLPEALTALRYRHPDAELSVVDLASDGGPELVASGELDFALTASYGQPPLIGDGVRLAHLLTDPLRAVLPGDHPMAQGLPGRSVRLDALRSDAWVCGIAGRPARAQLEAAAAKLDFAPYVPFQTESYDVAQALAASGVAVAFVPRLAVLDSPATRSRRLQPALTREIYAALPTSTSHVRLAAELLTVMRKICAGLRHQGGR